MTDIILVLDREGRYLKIAPTNSPLLYKPSKEILGKTLFDVFPEKEAIYFHNIIIETIETKEPQRVQYPLKINGKEIWFSAIISALSENTVVWVARDITKIKVTEDSLRNECNTARKYLDVAGVMFVIIGADQKVQLINKIGSKILGYEVDQIIGKNWFDNFIPQSMRENVREAFEKILSGDIEPLEYIENTVLTSKEEERLMAFHNTILKNEDGKITATLSSGEDITERRQTLIKLKDSEEKYRKLVDSANDAIILADAQTGKIIDVSRSAEKLFKKPAKELIGMHQSELHPKEDADNYRKIFQKYVGKTAGIAQNLFAVDAENKRIPIEISSNVFELKGRNVILGIFRDVAERKKAEEIIRDSEEKYRKLIESTNDYIFLADTQTGKLIDVNNRVVNFMNIPKRDILHLNYSDLHPVEEREIYENIFKETIEKGQAVKGSIDLQNKNGDKIPVEISSNVIDLKGKKIIQGIFRDISERLTAEEALKQKDREIRKAYVEVFSAVTGGRLVIMSKDEINESLGSPITEIKEIESYEKLSSSRDFLFNALKSQFLSINNIDDIILASNEALTNAIKHAGGAFLQIFDKAGTAQIMIFDKGMGIDFGILPKATLLSGFSTKQSLGLGFSIMLEYSDRLLLSTMSTGTTIVMEIRSS